ncbi:hypothetical protein IWX90DRAFT_86675 [Phyllosticta citrichinensis]|uniref:Uncharacterized protein n=1 Tax=Phyllosticta citrichinensis TaxID=1130410 RepID=A0ABR1XFI5_9PEZI
MSTTYQNTNMSKETNDVGPEPSSFSSPSPSPPNYPLDSSPTPFPSSPPTSPISRLVQEGLDYLTTKSTPKTPKQQAYRAPSSPPPLRKKQPLVEADEPESRARWAPPTPTPIRKKRSLVEVEADPEPRAFRDPPTPTPIRKKRSLFELKQRSQSLRLLATYADGSSTPTPEQISDGEAGNVQHMREGEESCTFRSVGSVGTRGFGR